MVLPAWVAGIAIPLFLALASWNAKLSANSRRSAEREALQEHRISTLEVRMNSHADKMDQVIQSLTELKSDIKYLLKLVNGDK